MLNEKHESKYALNRRVTHEDNPAPHLSRQSTADRHAGR